MLISGACLVGFLFIVLLIAGSHGQQGRDTAESKKLENVTTATATKVACQERVTKARGETLSTQSIDLTLSSVQPVEYPHHEPGTATKPGENKLYKLLRVSFLAANKTNTVLDVKGSFNSLGITYYVDGKEHDGLDIPVAIEPQYGKSNTDSFQPFERRTIKFRLLDGNEVIFPLLFEQSKDEGCPRNGWKIK